MAANVFNFDGFVFASRMAVFDVAREFAAIRAICVNFLASMNRTLEISFHFRLISVDCRFFLLIFLSRDCRYELRLNSVKLSQFTYENRVGGEGFSGSELISSALLAIVRANWDVPKRVGRRGERRELFDAARAENVTARKNSRVREDSRAFTARDF